MPTLAETQIPWKPRKGTQPVKDAQALSLRMAGASYAQIAAQMGFANKGGAYKAVQRSLRDSMKQRDQEAEEVIALELARLDAYQLGLYKRATSGDPRAIEVALRIMERRSAYLGLDAPKRQEISGPEGGAIQVEQEVVYSYEERQQRIIAIVDAARARASLPAGSARSDLDSPGWSPDSSLADAG